MLFTASHCLVISQTVVTFILSQTSWCLYTPVFLLQIPTSLFAIWYAQIYAPENFHTRNTCFFCSAMVMHFMLFLLYLNGVGYTINKVCQFPKIAATHLLYFVNGGIYFWGWPLHASAILNSFISSLPFSKFYNKPTVFRILLRIGPLQDEVY